MFKLKHIFLAILVIACAVKLILVMFPPRIKLTANTSAMTEEDIAVENFSGFSYSYGNAMHVYWKLRVSANGEVIYYHLNHRIQPGKYSRAEFKLSKKELSALLAKLRGENFVQLYDYYDYGYFDVDNIHISLKCNGMIKSTGCNNYDDVPPPPIESISSFIHTHILAPHDREINNATPITLEEIIELDSIRLD
ncbi:MAG: hypothetical protein COA78_20005 [Blastopirellula sp.]|nr:MAG: hypothetical protein COA78_20005 [Blastopirellula sp.]